MATYIKTLKEDNGDITYPQTKGSAVLLEGGSDLETVLAAKADASTVNQKITIGDVQSTDIVANAVTTAKIADSNVTTAKLANGAVTAAKIDWSSLGYQHVTSSTSVTVNTTTTTLASFSLTAGTWLLIGTTDFNHNNTSIADSYAGFWNNTTNNSIGNMFYFNEVNNGTWFNTVTVHEVVTLTSTATIAFVAKRSQGTLASSRRSFTAIRIG